jgi:hypothetical protein
LYTVAFEMLAMHLALRAGLHSASSSGMWCRQGLHRVRAQKQPQRTQARATIVFNTTHMVPADRTVNALIVAKVLLRHPPDSALIHLSVTGSRTHVVRAQRCDDWATKLADDWVCLNPDGHARKP